MLDSTIITLLQNKIYIAALLLVCALITGAYFLGVKDGYVPASILCKDTILLVDQCKTDKANQQKIFTNDLIKCTTECKLNTCDKICSDKVKSALESYKRLLTDIKCGAIK